MLQGWCLQPPATGTRRRRLHRLPGRSIRMQLRVAQPPRARRARRAPTCCSIGFDGAQVRCDGLVGRSRCIGGDRAGNRAADCRRGLPAAARRASGPAEARGSSPGVVPVQGAPTPPPAATLVTSSSGGRHAAVAGDRLVEWRDERLAAGGVAQCHRRLGSDSHHGARVRPPRPPLVRHRRRASPCARTRAGGASSTAPADSR